MKKFTFAGIAASAVAAGFIGLAAPAMAAPSGGTDADDTISSLQDQGYSVVVKNPNNVPLDQASVSSITPINSTELVWDAQHDHRHQETRATSYIVTVN